MRILLQFTYYNKLCSKINNTNGFYSGTRPKQLFNFRYKLTVRLYYSVGTLLCYYRIIMFFFSMSIKFEFSENDIKCFAYYIIIYSSQRAAIKNTALSERTQRAEPSSNTRENSLFFLLASALLTVQNL